MRNVLIGDTSAQRARMLVKLLGPNYDCVVETRGSALASMLYDGEYIPDIAILHSLIGGVDIFTLLHAIKQHLPHLPVIVIVGRCSNEWVERAYEEGAIDVVQQPYNHAIFKRRVDSIIEVFSKNAFLRSEVVRHINAQRKDAEMLISLLSHTIEFRNTESASHVFNVQNITRILLTEVNKHYDNVFKKEDIYRVSMAASLHDLGKVAIPEAILNKPGSFTDEEYAIMKEHANIGANICGDLMQKYNEPVLHIAHVICKWHHERWDGSGYPDHLVGNAIPLTAQVVALADVLDALTSERCYKPRYSKEEAIRMITDGECGAFNPLLIECLHAVAPTIHLEE